MRLAVFVCAVVCVSGLSQIHQNFATSQIGKKQSIRVQITCPQKSVEEKWGKLVYLNNKMIIKRTYDSFGQYMPIFLKTRTLVSSFWYFYLTISATEGCLMKR